MHKIMMDVRVQRQLIGNHVGNGLRVRRRARAAAVDVIGDARQLVCDSVGNVRAMYEMVESLAHIPSCCSGVGSNNDTAIELNSHN